MIVVDTDVLIEIFDKKSEKGDEALKKIVESGESVSITVMNLHEVLYGLHKYAKPVKDVLRLPVLNYTKEDARLAANIELQLERKGITVRRTDAIVASIVINNKASLYTLDLKHFEPMKAFGLKLFC
jgi:tRNA(fMet)-specific endonuclease VapC